jgi:hypothetical protein
MDITTAQLVTTETILVLHAPASSVEIISLCVLSVDLVASMHSTYSTSYIPRLKYGIREAYIG